MNSAEEAVHADTSLSAATKLAATGMEDSASEMSAAPAATILTRGVESTKVDGMTSEAEALAEASDSLVVPPFDTSSKCSCLFWLTRKIPTNYDMLVFRTLNRELGRPNTNDDYLAMALRDELMPSRSWCLRKLPWVKRQTLAGLESPRFGVPGCINFIDARTKWFDEIVVDAVTTRGIKQIVIVAAGFDTRAYRLAQPGVRFIEVDLPSASERKKKLAAKLGWLQQDGSTAGVAQRHPEYVAADLSRVALASALRATSFDPKQPTLFTVEGLIYYLPHEAAHRLVASIGSMAAPGSILQFDYMNIEALKGRGKGFPGFQVTAKAVANKGEPYLSGLENSPEAVQRFVGLHGFRLRQHMGPREMCERMLPHVIPTWNDKMPPIASFYSYASVIKQ